MGSLIALFIHTGAVSAFTESVITRAHSKKGGLLTAWVLGLFLFVDDYLNSIAVGAAMRKVTDSFGTSREMLAYVVDSTAAPVSVVVPISTWAVFFGALLVENVEKLARRDFGGLLTEDLPHCLLRGRLEVRGWHLRASTTPNQGAAG